MTWSAFFSERAQLRAKRQQALLVAGLDFRSLLKLFFASIDPKILIALGIIALFARSLIEDPKDDTLKGALIAAFAGAWGYYLGNSNNAARAGDRSDASLAIAHEAIKALPAPIEPKVDAVLKAGDLARVEGEREAE